MQFSCKGNSKKMFHTRVWNAAGPERNNKWRLKKIDQYLDKELSLSISNRFIHGVVLQVICTVPSI